jgi:hypothetical protein
LPDNLYTERQLTDVIDNYQRRLGIDENIAYIDNVFGADKRDTYFTKI